MVKKRTPASDGRGALNRNTQAGQPISTLQNCEYQALVLARRFRLSPALAAIVARLHFSEAK
jgi:hypothetical protein